MKPMRGCAPTPKYPVTFPMYFSIKYDGIRITMDGDDPKTRSLKTLPNLHVVSQLKADPRFRDLDLELIVGDPTDPLCYNTTYSGVMTIKGEPTVSFYIFDVIAEGHTFEQRLAYLKELEKDLPPNCYIVEQILVENQEQLDALYAKVTGMGHEGLMGKLPKGHYKFGKCTPKEQLCLKLKPEEDGEFRILSFYEALENTNEAFENELGETDRSSHAEGKVPKGTLGGFVAEDIVTGVKFRCGPGKMPHDLRKEVWENQSKFKPMIGKYRHFPVGVVEKPRHPRWIGWWDQQ